MSNEINRIFTFVAIIAERNDFILLSIVYLIEGIIYGALKSFFLANIATLWNVAAMCVTRPTNE